MRRLIASIGLVALLSTAPLATGCWGSFALTNKVYDWNAQASQDKFVTWLVFLALVIIPVYEVSLLVDAVVFNSVEFWSGSNPVETASVDREGEGAVVRRGEETFRVVPKEDGEVYVYREGELVGRARVLEGGAIAVLDPEGREIRRISAGEAARARSRGER